MASEVHCCIKPSKTAWAYAVPCLTLEQFSVNASEYSYSNISLTLEFLPGNRSLSSPIFIGYIAYMKLFSQAKNVNITCTNHGCFRFTGIARVELTYLTFHGYGLKTLTKFPNKVLSVLFIYSSNLYLNECKFYHLKETVILSEHSNIKIYKSEFINSSRGVLDSFQSNVTDVGSYYYGNRIKEGFNFVLLTDSGYYLNFSLCTFHRNGPLLLCRSSTFIFHMCECTENIAKFEVVNVLNSNFTLESSTFRGNIGLKYALTVQWSNLMMKNATILDNEAHSGPVLQFKRSTMVTYDDITIAGNIPWNNSVSTLSFEDSTKANVMGKLLFANNSGVFLVSNSKVVFHGIAMFLNNSNFNTQFSMVSKIQDGGAISCINGIVQFADSVTFTDNYCRNNGGALSAVGSKIYIHKNILVANNLAENHGGGIYLFSSQFTCEMNCSFSKNIAKRGDGGGLRAVDSKVFLGDEHVHYESIVSLTFRNNSAVCGGGLYFEVNSELRGPRESEQRYEIIFDNNDALTEGKAIYINDSTYLATCSLHHAQCFLQTSPPSSPYSLQDKQIKIIGNTTKSTIFGGLLDKCFVNNAFREENPMSGIEYLITMTKNREIFTIIASEPVRACFCIDETVSNCTTLSVEYELQKGEQFNVTIAAVDQVNSSVSASIVSALTFQGSHLGIGQSNQHTPAMCINLTFNIYSLNDHNETLKIHPHGRCGSTEDENTLSVHITFKDCSCPEGFHVDKRNKTSCECECDARIAPYKAQCSLSRVIRNNEAQGWISYNKDSGFLYHPFCPHDFCLPPAIPVCIDLNLPNGSDAQCAFDRVDLLCGKCKPGYSLSLSSSRCLQCPKINWPWAFLILMVKIIGGIVLVAVILMLNLTVSVGTLNGLIFYANIFAADSSLFLSFTEQNFFTVFLAWLNLDFGFDVCFFKGIDAYSKAWLNILFPSYVIAVLILIVLISKYSLQFGRLIGRWNPVATLATLLLLSYTKLLRGIISALSFTIITYPTGQHKAVWLQDASVKFFGLKHFPLGLLAIVIIIVGFTYTVLLFSWQWILKLPSSRNTRLNLFMEANLAPYKAKYRYWYGLLLFIRMALYLEIATEKYHESVTIVLVIALIAASILLLRTFFGSNVYRNRFIGYLNSSFYYNLLALSLARLYCQYSISCQKRSSMISIALAFILFVFILSYHILCALLEIRHFRHVTASIQQMLHLKKLRVRPIDDPRVQESEMQKTSVIAPTSTEIILSPCKDSSDHEYKASSKSADSKMSTDGDCMQQGDSNPADRLMSMRIEETAMNDSFDNENVCKQKAHKKNKQWKISNTLEEPLLQD